MFRSVVTCAKCILFLLNIWVLCVVLVVVLGKWQIFSAREMTPPYDASHLVVMRELKENDQLVFQPAPVKPVPPAQSIVKRELELVQKMEQPLIKDPVTSEREERMNNINEWCKKILPNKPDLSLIPSVKLQQILVDDKNKFLYCQTPGVAQPDWRKIIVYLSGAAKVKSHLDISVSDVFTKYNKNLKKLSDFPSSERKKKIETYYKFAFVREPLERLYSSYDNKIKAKWSTYFHQNYGKKIIQKYRKKASKVSLEKGNDVTFNEFIQYIVDANKQDESLNEHWEKYYKLCHPCMISYDFMGKYEKLESDIDHVLKQTHVREKFKGQLVSTSFSYPNKVLSQAYKSVSQANLLKLWKMYYPDYNIFSYDYPAVLKELLQTKTDFNDY